MYLYIGNYIYNIYYIYVKINIERKDDESEVRKF